MQLSELVNFKSNKSRLEDIKINRRNIIPFVGAGISKACGLYTWGELLHKLALDYLTDEEILICEEKGDFFNYADKIIQEAGNSDMIMKNIRDIFSEAELVIKETPFLIVSSFSKMIITTNYDNVLETASENSKLGYLKPLLPCLIGQVNEGIQINDRRLIKLHGSVEETQSFVFSTEQYKKFYGDKNNRKNKLLPQILVKIFTGKKVLFIGSSLEKDYTLDILQECVQNDNSIFHYAIVPLPKERNMQILKNRELSSLGIEPIYYPEGDFEAVNRLINYLAEENEYIKAVKKFLLKFVINERIKEKDILIIVNILKESFYKTSSRFSSLLDIENVCDNFLDDITKSIGEQREQAETLFNICIETFSIYIHKGYIRHKEECLKYFRECFSNLILIEGSIEKILYENWSIERFLSTKVNKEFLWINKLSNDEANTYAKDLLRKLQYKNGMEFSELAPVYELAKKFIEYLSNKLDFNTKIKLLNSIGAFGHYFGDVEGAVKHLELCIFEIENSGIDNRKMMLFKAKCYANLAIARSLDRNNTDINSIMEACEKDINLKKKYCESNLLLSRSLDFYATILKEKNPFKSCEIYLEVMTIKKELINEVELDDQKKSELTASWATTIFNIGLLAKDLELYDIAYRIICYANEYRFQTVNYHNRDYCSSINVRAELELFVHEKKNLNWLINGVKSRLDLPSGFSDTLAQTWYVCAYYYFLSRDYKTAMKYINKSIEVSNNKNALYDFRQHIRTLLLLGDIKREQTKAMLKNSVEVKKIYDQIIENLIEIYGEDSIYLLAPYRHVLKLDLSEEDIKIYKKKYKFIESLYEDKFKELEIILKKTFLENTKSG